MPSSSSDVRSTGVKFSQWLITLSLLVTIPFSYAWDIDRSFDEGQAGSSTNRTSSGFDEAAEDSLFDSTRSVSGGQAAKLSISQGDQGFGRWGGIINHPDVYGNEDLWMDLYIYIPSDFRVSTNTGSLKFLRFRGKKVDGTNGGALDIQLRNEGDSTPFRVSREFSDNDWINFGENSDFKRDRWHRITTHIKAHHDPASEGGNGRVRMWLNGEQILDDTSLNTLVWDGAWLSDYLLFTYWNGNSPRTQSLWIDELKLSNEAQPSWANDLQIDLSNVNGPIAPLPPSNISIIQ